MRLIWVIVLLAGCTTLQPKIGMSDAEYQKKCKNAAWKRPKITEFASGEVVMECKGAERPYHLFRDGQLIAALSKQQFVSHIEHEKCVAGGADPETETYINCRMVLAYQRAQQEATERETGNTVLLRFSPELRPNNQQKAFRYLNNTADLRAHCSSQPLGRYTYFSCF